MPNYSDIDIHNSPTAPAVGKNGDIWVDPATGILHTWLNGNWGQNVSTGDDLAVRSITVKANGPYSASSIPGSFNNEYRLPPPTGTDDTAAIAAAETAVSTYGSGKIVFQSGTYLASTLTKQSFCYWEGAGIDSTQLKLKNGVNGDLITGANFGTLTGGNTVGGIHHWGIKDMTLSGNKVNQSGTSYVLRAYAYGYKLEHVKINDALNDGIYSEWANTVGLPATNEEDVWAFLKNVQVYRSGQNGIHWLGPHDSGWKFVWAGKNGNHGFWLDATGVASGSGSKAENCHAFANTQNQWRLATQASLLECKGESTTAFTAAGVAMLYIGTGSNDTDVIGGAYGTFSSSLHSGIGIELNAPGGLSDLHIDTLVENVTTAAMKIGAGADAGGNYFALTAYLPDGGAVIFGTNNPAVGSTVRAMASGPNGASMWQTPGKIGTATTTDPGIRSDGNSLYVGATNGSGVFLRPAGNASANNQLLGTGGAWTTYDGAGVARNVLDDNTGKMTAKSTFTATKDLLRSRQTPTEAVLVSGVDATAGEIVYIAAITAARLVGNPTNTAVGQRLTFVLIQDGTGGRAITWNTAFKVTWSDAGNTLNKRSVISFIFDGGFWDQDGAQTPYV